MEQILPLLKEVRPPCVDEHADLWEPVQSGQEHREEMCWNQYLVSLFNPFHARATKIWWAMAYIPLSIHLLITLLLLFFWMGKPVRSPKIWRCARKDKWWKVFFPSWSPQPFKSHLKGSQGYVCRSPSQKYRPVHTHINTSFLTQRLTSMLFILFYILLF